MSYQLEALPNFKRELKRLKKKYPSLLHEVANLAAALAESSTQGTSLGQKCCKIRLAIGSKQQDKSGEARNYLRRGRGRAGNAAFHLR